MSITSKGKKACVILDNNQVVTKILVLQEVWELEGDMLLKFAVDVKKGTTLFMIDDSTEVTANDDYKAGDYLYFSKGTFHPTRVRFLTSKDNRYDWYSEVRFLKGFDNSQWVNMETTFGGYLNGYSDNSTLQIIDISNLDTSKVTSMKFAFSYCVNLERIELGNFDTNSLTNCEGMFCSSGNIKFIDASRINTSKCKSFYNMFYNCHSITSLDVSNFDTHNVTLINHMFNSCTSLTSLDVSNFDTSKVTDMPYMFYNCSSLTSLDVSNFDTSKVTDMPYMFYNCSSLTSLDVSNFDTSKVTNMRSMFNNCSSLTNLIFGSKWGTQTSTAADALTLDLHYLGSSKSYKLTDETYNSMLTMYDRASNGLTTMTIKFSTKHNLPDGFAEKMSALGYTITLV